MGEEYERNAQQHRLLATFLIGLIGAAIGAGGYHAYRYFTSTQTNTESVAADTSPADPEQLPQHETASPRDSLIETVGYQVAAERGLDKPTPEIEAEVSGSLERLEARYPKNDPEDFFECYQILNRARYFFPDITLAQLESMLYNEAPAAGNDIVRASHSVFQQIEYEYYRPQIEALEAQQQREQALNQTIQKNLVTIQQRAEAANTAQRMALANMGRRTPLEQRWLANYLARLHRPTLDPVRRYGVTRDPIRRY